MKTICGIYVDKGCNVLVSTLRITTGALVAPSVGNEATKRQFYGLYEHQSSEAVVVESLGQFWDRKKNLE